MPLRVDLSILNQKGTPAFFSDVFANRPAAGFAGRVFISTDTGAIYEDTGSTWTLIADATGVVTGFVPYTGATQSVNLGTNNISANAFFNSLNIVTASGTQVVLTINSAPVQLVTGSGGQTFKLPDATTLSNGTIFSFNNNQSSGAITVNNNSNTLVASIPSGGYTTVVLLDNSTAAGSWDRHDQTPSNVSWSTNTLDYAGSITSATWNGNVIAINKGGTGSATKNFVDLTTNQSIAGQKTFNPSITASGAIAQGSIFSPTLTAAANGDTLVGLDINPTFTNGAFTGVSNLAARFQDAILVTKNTNAFFTGINVTNANTNSSASATTNINSDVSLLTNSVYSSTRLNNSTNQYVNGPAALIDYQGSASLNIASAYSTGTNAGIRFWTGVSTNLATEKIRIFPSGNLTIQNGGTFTDNSYQLEIVGGQRNIVNSNTLYNNLTLTNTNSSSGASATLLMSADVSTASQFVFSSTRGSNNSNQYNTGASYLLDYQGLASLNFASSSGTSSNNGIRFWTGASTNLATERMRLFASGNLLLQSGGTFTDAGYKLDVNGTARVQGVLTASTSITTSGQVNCDNIALRAIIGLNLSNVSGTQCTLASYGNTVSNGTQNNYGIIPTNVTPQSNGIANILQVSPSGTASGNGSVRAIFIDGNMTLATGYYRAIETTRGDVALCTTSGTTLIGTTTNNGQGTLQNSGTLYTLGLAVGGITFSTNTTAVYTNVFYFYNGGAGVTLTLPAVNTKSNYYIIKNYSASPLTLAATGSDTFVAAGTIVTVATLTLASGASTTILGNGTVNWIQIQ